MCSPISQATALLSRSFAIEDRHGDQWVKLRCQSPFKKTEEIKIDATMFDDVAPIPEATKAVCEGEVKLLVNHVVKVSKEEDSDLILVFICSAWPESIEVQKVFPLGKRMARVQPYMG